MTTNTCARSCALATALLLLHLMPQQLFSQRFTYGIQAGMNVSTAAYLPEPEQGFIDPFNPNVGYQAGIFGEIKLVEKLGLSVEPGYIQKNLRLVESPFQQKGILQFHYIHLPVLLHFKPSRHWSVNAGPEIAHGLAIRARGSGFNNDVSQFWAVRPEYSMNLGAQYNFDQNISLGMRASHLISRNNEVLFTDENGIETVQSRIYLRSLLVFMRYRLDG